MLKKIDFKFLIGAVLALGLGVSTVIGITQEYVHFSGVENEIGFTFLSLFGGVIFSLGIKK